jgi:AcrR family transcriptional regulator
MNATTVSWAAPEDLKAGDGLRERKKRLMRQQLSDTATELFLERGFDAVRVADVAAACGVSEKTVFNYFPVKEALLLDRWDTTMASLREALGDPGAEPVAAVTAVLASELGALTGWLAGQPDLDQARGRMRRFGELIWSTAALRHHQHDVMDELIRLTAELLAGRAGMAPGDPEPQIAATALAGLWHVQAQSLRRHLAGTGTPEQIRDAVDADVRRAARLLGTGLAAGWPGAGQQGPAG